MKLYDNGGLGYVVCGDCMYDYFLPELSELEVCIKVSCERIVT